MKNHLIFSYENNPQEDEPLFRVSIFDNGVLQYEELDNPHKEPVQLILKRTTTRKLTKAVHRDARKAKHLEKSVVLSKETFTPHFRYIRFNDEEIHITISGKKESNCIFGPILDLFQSITDILEKYEPIYCGNLFYRLDEQQDIPEQIDTIASKLRTDQSEYQKGLCYDAFLKFLIQYNEQVYISSKALKEPTTNAGYTIYLFNDLPQNCVGQYTKLAFTDFLKSMIKQVGEIKINYTFYKRSYSTDYLRAVYFYKGKKL